MRRYAAMLVATLAPLWIAAGCAGKKAQVPPEQLWDTATEAYNEEAYEYAVQHYKKFLDQYPFDPRAEKAELQIAYSHFEMKRYPESIAAFADFERMHPTSTELPRVEYSRGLAYAAQHRSFDRDQSAATSANAAFKSVMDRFPGTPWAERSALRFRECRETVARHEGKVAGFYLRRKSLRAAEARLRGLLVDYPETDATSDALAAFADAYDVRGEAEGATLARASLLRLKPEASAATDARAKLGKAPATNPVPDLVAYIDRMRSDTDRTTVPKTVSSYPNAPGSR